MTDKELNLTGIVVKTPLIGHGVKVVDEECDPYFEETEQKYPEGGNGLVSLWNALLKLLHLA